MASVVIAEQGSFVRLRGAAQPGNKGGGIRGKVCGFSRESRKRFLDFLNQVDKSAVNDALFVTLTYPDCFCTEPARWKRDLDVFLKRFNRKYPVAAVVWRMEFKVRQSGVNAGAVAPHFHLLVFGLPLLPKDLLSRWWYEVVDSGDPKHLQAGTQVARVHSRRGVLGYASKYISKVDEGCAFEGGRVWGIVGRENLPVYLLSIAVPWKAFYKMRRVLRGWLARRLGRKLKYAGLRGQGMTAYLDGGAAGRLLAWAMVG
jgi:hypothetical protein